jgi:hypothetical protein
MMGAPVWQDVAVYAVVAGAAAWLLVLRRRRARHNCDACSLAAAARDLSREAPGAPVKDPPRSTPAAR